MVYRKLIPLVMLIATMLTGQTPQLSVAARKLLSKPQLGNVQVTWSDGRTEDIRVVRVTDQFVTLLASPKPQDCENVDLSKIAAVQWLRTSGDRSVKRLGGEVLVGSALSPFFVGHAVPDPFRRIFPPLEPLRGDWESIRPSRGGCPSPKLYRATDLATWLWDTTSSSCSDSSLIW